MTTTARYEVVAGNRLQPGEVLVTFAVGQVYRCGGPAMACLQEYERLERRGVVCFFRRVGA